MKSNNRVVPLTVTTPGGGLGAKSYFGLDGVVASSTSGAAEMTAPKDGEVKISLRIQYLQNSTEYLLKYKQKLH